MGSTPPCTCCVCLVYAVRVRGHARCPRRVKLAYKSMQKKMKSEKSKSQKSFGGMFDKMVRAIHGQLLSHSLDY